MHIVRGYSLPAGLTLIFACLVSMPLSAAQITVEAEHFTAFHDITFNPIEQYTVGMYVTLRGPDFPGEWVEYALPVSEFGSYSFSMICWGDLGITYTFNVYFVPDSGGETQSITTSFTGTGCFT